MYNKNRWLQTAILIAGLGLIFTVSPSVRQVFGAHEIRIGNTNPPHTRVAAGSATGHEMSLLPAIPSRRSVCLASVILPGEHRARLDSL